MRSSLAGALGCALLACTSLETESEPAVVARSPEDVRSEAEELFRILDRDADGRLVEAELVGVFVDLLHDDLDGDGAVSVAEIEESLGPALVSASFEARGEDLVMVGLIDGATPARLEEALDAHPGARRLVLERVDGSIDHEATFAAGRIVRARGLATHVPAEGAVASGGVDLFLSGVARTAEPGASLGVHSWALDLLDLELEGRDLPRESAEHEVQLAWLRELGIPEAWYWFTLEQACAHEIHWMSAEEVARFGLLAPPDPGFVPGTGGEPVEHEEHAGPLAPVAFLAGGWRSERGGLVFEERWSRPAGGVMLGWGRATRGGELLSFEVLRLEATDEGLFYVAMPGGGRATRFRLVESSAGFAAFENPEHDDPRRIAYALGADGTLSARLSPEVGPDAKPTLGFDFEPDEL
jgi:hypothetical protein